ncbi:hypothetical protein WICPIJ_009678 [Wickerhamomyces pijperi]|uniref:Uncharacterized protein n=1 Tax=Wickerhamomyces pijperi TaxID=599730 RepID=A0A9P8PLT4_WICPI|nr:hypothetical protein WICPIJ_009678 [Wickerhamomyces pijperi]
MCSPAGDMWVKTHGSDLDNLFKPSTNFGKSEAFLTSTATWTTGETENFMTFKLWAASEVVKSSIGSVLEPIIKTTLWTALMNKSFLEPGTIYPYQRLEPSWRPVTGDGKCKTIISNKASAAGKNFFITAFNKALPSNSFSSFFKLISNFSNKVGISSFLKFMMAENNLKIGSKTNMLKALSNGLPSASLSLLVHFLVFGLKHVTDVGDLVHQTSHLLYKENMLVIRSGGEIFLVVLCETSLNLFQIWD